MVGSGNVRKDESFLQEVIVRVVHAPKGFMDGLKLAGSPKD